MAGSAIRRLGHTISDDGLITYHDQPATWADVDRLAGRRMDRRRCYAIIDGDDGAPALHEAVRWSQACTGCTNDYDAQRGMGCPECGYQGRVRNAAWVPVSVLKEVRP